MNRNVASGFGLAVCLAVAACGGEKAPAEPSGTNVEKGMLGVYYYVNVSRPTGGTIRSADGKINCGTAGTPTGCAQARYQWSETASLTAVPDAGQYFQSWAADCSGSVVDGCILNTAAGGADKWVVAVFNPPGRLGHGTIASPSLHAPKFFKFLANDPSAPRCNTCHGASYAGQAIAPSCNACHAAAGWADWQQSCSFCHGRKDVAAKAGYDFALHPDWAAPPDDVKGRLTGLPSAAAGAHQAHVAPNEFRSPIACSECHLVPATAIHTLNQSLDLPFGPLSRSGGAVPLWEASTLTCSANYCHGNFNYDGVQGKAASLSWTGSLTGCTTCHEMPPTGHAYSSNPDPASCAGCHGGTVNGDGTIDVAGGLHINGQKDASGGACDSCHWFPNSLSRLPTGAHLAHFGLDATQASSGFGDLGTLETKYPTSTPTTAPSAYAFGCGNCHPIATGQHSMGSGSTVAKVWLYEAAAPTGSLKAKNPSSAAFDPTAKTCNNVYCHSSGQETTPASGPTYVITPAWNSGTHLGCASCHQNPPKYTSGGAGEATANSHVQLDVDGYPWGHYGFPMPSYSYSQHGQGNNPYYGYVNSAPLTCQTCHFGTTDPSNTGDGGFYYLDTTGDYTISPNGYGAWGYTCTACHGIASYPTAKVGTGKVLPLRHVNGTRDVEFDNRTGSPNVNYVPGTVVSPDNNPTRPYWITSGSGSRWGAEVTNATFLGTTVQFDFSNSAYNSKTKTCTNVACHLSQGNTNRNGLTIADRFYPLQWGATHYYMGTDPATGVIGCNLCHRM
jgi:predicted CxxxxCH...CXXCH cytochrome family protein